MDPDMITRIFLVYLEWLLLRLTHTKDRFFGWRSRKSEGEKYEKQRRGFKNKNKDK
ncbi:hypothetical protein BDV37DRAFT_61037 [Aspergillus pseudonomiae]|uniref:Uncharacterized protein n=1 Tax=Aspergillus pseudonomiae TaxID=1506151 RepID=A0A5N7CSX9_9EURO|nr:uncharacterized protein BDV37DRAFT_61037 [Aspergillus pseudonomiae]KAE8397311.1 hypothetical protein BDV37DRAFT_61037 [Aspergillus pseudonomiae]